MLKYEQDCSQNGGGNTRPLRRGQTFQPYSILKTFCKKRYFLCIHEDYNDFRQQKKPCTYIYIQKAKRKRKVLCTKINTIPVSFYIQNE